MWHLPDGPEAGKPTSKWAKPRKVGSTLLPAISWAVSFGAKKPQQNFCRGINWVNVLPRKLPGRLQGWI